MEFIPVGRIKGNNLKPKKQRHKAKKRKWTPRPYIADPKIIPRIRQYMKANEHLTHLDLEDMTEYLHNNYRDYRSRKLQPFSDLVQKAYSAILDQYGIESSDYSSDSDKEENGHMDGSVKTTYNGNINSAPIDETEVMVIDQPPRSSNSVPGTKFTEKTGNMIETEESEGKQNKKRKKDGASGISPFAKKKKFDVIPTEPTVQFSDVGGNENTLKEVAKMLLHLKHPEVYESLGVSAPRGFLLHGPPGCGKTLLVHAIAGELKLPLLKVCGPEVVSGVSGESEEKLRALFDQARSTAPCIIFIDEIDSITGKRDNANKDMERRIVAQLLTCLDELGAEQTEKHVLVVGATNRIDALDPGLRRAGRFDREISLGIPDEKGRKSILKVLVKEMKLGDDCEFEWLARNTPGYVGADLKALTREAAVACVSRAFHELRHVKACITEDVVEGKEIETETVIPPKVCLETSIEDLLSWLHEQPPLNQEQLARLFVEKRDFETALSKVQPSAKREGFATVPDVTWEDIGALDAIKEELQISILAPVRHPEACESLGLSSPGGVLLCGPPGCGKTLLAKAVANEAQINFISVKGPELLNMYVGESERAVRQCFQRGRSSAPCVIFFDEIDALCPKRSDSADGGSSARVVNQLLTEMDGMDGRKGVCVMAATNRPDILDPAVLRPGRLEKRVYVGLPTASDRPAILRALTKNGSHPLLGEDVDLNEIGLMQSCDGFSGADLAALVREASMASLRELLSQNQKTEAKVYKRHFLSAFVKVRPSVSTGQLKNASLQNSSCS